MSKNISFVKTPEELAGIRKVPSLYANKKNLSFSWAIDDALYRKVLPPPLEPTYPIVSGFVSVFTHAGFCLPSYSEGALFLACSYKGVPGVYCLAMPIDGENEMGILLGREMYNYPKKVAKIDFERRGDEIYASITRNGIQFFEIKAEVGPGNHPEAATYMPEPPLNTPGEGPVYLIDYKLECQGYHETPTSVITFNNIKLFAQNNREQVHSYERLNIEVNFQPSEDDPWIELAPKVIIGGAYTIMDTEMFGTKLVYEYKSPEDQAAILPYLFTRYDGMVFGKQHEIHR